MNAAPVAERPPSVRLVADGCLESLTALLARYGLAVRLAGPGERIPGSFWGEPEAGLVRDTVWLRADTPVHSVLHEACHAICMDGARRATLDRDAGGTDPEENAVCYLQIRLADELPGVGAGQLLADMDAWGYTFRLGSARAWYEGEADDARAWLLGHGLIDDAGRPTGRVRT